MTARKFRKRQELIANGCCPRCERRVEPWPLKRADVCAPREWVVCIRHWPDIMKAEKRLAVYIV